MEKRMKILKFLGLLVAGLVVAAGATAQGARPIPSTPAAAEAVYAAPFVLRQGYRSDWGQERPLVTSGFVVVARVHPDLVYPRQVAEPVLYAGNQVAEKVNVGYRSGYVVAIVPGALDLARDPVWFGRPALPEQVSARTVRAELQRAAAAGIRAVPPRIVRDKVQLQDREAVLRIAAELIRQYAPDETELADNLAPLPR
jgi:hypothetical protein